jgi:N-acetylglucosaminyl-diphospho-decaprenol L-rhamnosyltransferase
VSGDRAVSVVVVSRDVRSLLAKCLESLHSAPVTEVLVVDAASADGSDSLVADQFPEVRLVRSRENLGFTRGNNWALRLVRGGYVMLLNPDTVVEPGAIERLVGYLDTHPDVGAVGPKLVYPDGTVQSSRRRFPTRLTGFVESTVLERWLGNSAILRRYRLADRSAEEEQDVDWLMGAAILLRREALEQAGIFDERFFMYSEEIDLCRRLRLAGWRVAYLPTAVVVHHEGRSSEQNLRGRNVHFHESRFRYYRKHFGKGWMLALRLVTLSHFLFLAAEEAGKLVLGSRPELRRSRLWMLRDVLRTEACDLAAAVRS